MAEMSNGEGIKEEELLKERKFRLINEEEGPRIEFGDELVLRIPIQRMDTVAGEMTVRLWEPLK